MAVKVGVSGVTTQSVAVAGSTTQVKKIVVGTPVRRVSGSTTTVNTLEDVDVSNLENGSLLVYNTTRSKWIATKEVSDSQQLNGGSF